MKQKILPFFASLIFFAASARSAETNILANKFIAWNWRVADGTLQTVSVEDKLNGGTLPLSGESFQLVLGDGTVVKSSELKLLAPPKVERLKPEANSPVAARHFSGKELVVDFSAPEKHLAVEWRAILRDGSACVRQELTLRATGGDVCRTTILDVWDRQRPLRVRRK